MNMVIMNKLRDNTIYFIVLHIISIKMMFINESSNNTYNFAILYIISTDVGKIVARK